MKYKNNVIGNYNELGVRKCKGFVCAITKKYLKFPDLWTLCAHCSKVIYTIQLKFQHIEYLIRICRTKSQLQKAHRKLLTEKSMYNSRKSEIFSENGNLVDGMCKQNSVNKTGFIEWLGHFVTQRL